ncbi:hypothetical protein NA57DRAFT_73176 [Rhizodiscina lignyota]|uniref:RING-type domain-containing protein n=1 Tax=Rhizodiscina lignyota TaxID=1504668 RepID=A0A9P4MDK3_9PEZI|nr:hypothetical protein NA57DRAFT_73176 [Rhizodiscina lignyota]
MPKTATRATISTDAATATSQLHRGLRNRPALTQEIAQFPTKVLGRFSSVLPLEKWEGNVCGICLEPYEENDMVKQIPCGHFYHRECLARMLVKMRSDVTCPVCRRAIFTEDKLHLLDVDRRAKSIRYPFDTDNLPPGIMTPLETVKALERAARHVPREYAKWPTWAVFRHQILLNRASEILVWAHAVKKSKATSFPLSLRDFYIGQDVTELYNFLTHFIMDVEEDQHIQIPQKCVLPFEHFIRRGGNHYRNLQQTRIPCPDLPPLPPLHFFALLGRPTSPVPTVYRLLFSPGAALAAAPSPSRQATPTAPTSIALATRPPARVAPENAYPRRTDGLLEVYVEQPLCSFTQLEFLVSRDLVSHYAIASPRTRKLLAYTQDKISRSCRKAWDASHKCRNNEEICKWEQRVGRHVRREYRRLRKFFYYAQSVDNVFPPAHFPTWSRLILTASLQQVPLEVLQTLYHEGHLCDDMI